MTPLPFPTGEAPTALLAALGAPALVDPPATDAPAADSAFAALVDQAVTDAASPAAVSAPIPHPPPADAAVANPAEAAIQILIAPTVATATSAEKSSTESRTDESCSETAAASDAEEDGTKSEQPVPSALPLAGILLLAKPAAPPSKISSAQPAGTVTTIPPDPRTVRDTPLTALSPAPARAASAQAPHGSTPARHPAAIAFEHTRSPCLAGNPAGPKVCLLPLEQPSGPAASPGAPDDDVNEPIAPSTPRAPLASFARSRVALPSAASAFQGSPGAPGFQISQELVTDSGLRELVPTLSHLDSTPSAADSHPQTLFAAPAGIDYATSRSPAPRDIDVTAPVATNQSDTAPEADHPMTTAWGAEPATPTQPATRTQPATSAQPATAQPAAAVRPAADTQPATGDGSGFSRDPVPRQDLPGEGRIVPAQNAVRARMELASSPQLERQRAPEFAEAQPILVPDVEAVQAPASSTAGTTVASQAPQMKTAGKELPTASEREVSSEPIAASAAASVGSRSKQGHSATSSRPTDRAAALLVETRAWNWLTFPANAPLETHAPTVDVAADTAAASPAAAVERLEQLVTREVAVLRKLRAESLTVVLKPDRHTEMVLQLQCRPDGPLEATLRCDPEVCRQFQGHWAQLHDSLAQMNVRLQPLRENLPLAQTPVDSSTSPTLTGQNAAASHEDRPRHGERRNGIEETESAAPRLGDAPSTGGDRRARRTPAQGWESWA